MCSSPLWLLSEVLSLCSDEFISDSLNTTLSWMWQGFFFLNLSSLTRNLLFICVGEYLLMFPSITCYYNDYFFISRFLALLKTGNMLYSVCFKSLALGMAQNKCLWRRLSLLVPIQNPYLYNVGSLFLAGMYSLGLQTLCPRPFAFLLESMRGASLGGILDRTLRSPGFPAGMGYLWAKAS